MKRFVFRPIGGTEISERCLFLSGPPCQRPRAPRRVLQRDGNRCKDPSFATAHDVCWSVSQSSRHAMDNGAGLTIVAFMGILAGISV